MEQLLQDTVPKLDVDLFQYTLSFLNDATSDHSLEALLDFLSPILESENLSSDSIFSLCQSIAQKRGTSSLSKEQGPQELSQRIQMSGLTSNTLSFTQNRVVDIRHGSTKIVNSQVDQKKLKLAEKKLAEKRLARGLLAQDEIPVWNPDVKPAIIVNQLKPSSTLESRSKDIKLENFDIAFAGKKILENANMTLVFGQRYGLVGKNGVGKSTLLRAIAHKELYIPSHIRVLHVEQEVRIHAFFLFEDSRRRYHCLGLGFASR